MPIESTDSSVRAPDVLGKARQHMLDRAATYDKPEGERSMAKTVEVFNAFHGTSLTEAQGWHFMQILKDVRLFTRESYHADSAEDAVAYAALKAEALANRIELVISEHVFAKEPLSDEAKQRLLKAVRENPPKGFLHEGGIAR